jgi:hypothetical protein
MSMKQPVWFATLFAEASSSLKDFTRGIYILPPDGGVFSTVSLTQTAADVPKSHQLRRKFEVSAKIGGKWENTETGLAVDAVPCELFSRANSLLTGKDTEKFAPLLGTRPR